MKVLLLLALCFVAQSSAKWDWWKNFVDNIQQKNIILDYVHRYRFEEHIKGDQKLLIAISSTRDDKSCHVIEIDENLDKYLQDQDHIEAITEEIYNLINNNEQDETAMTRAELFKVYHDAKLNAMCTFLKTYAMKYTPSMPAPTTESETPTTQAPATNGTQT